MAESSTEQPQVAMAPGVRRRKGLLPANRARRQEWLIGYLFLLPDALGLLLFLGLPALFAIYTSFFSWNGVQQRVFVGLGNYTALLGDPLFGGSLKVTVLYMVMFVPSLFIVSLGLALLLVQKIRLRLLFRTAFFLPIVTSGVIVGLIWNFMYDPQVGVLNYILETLHLPDQSWVGDAHSALPSLVLTSVWWNAGYYMIIFMAGLQDIPRDYYEAAHIDGANRWQSFWGITWPLLKPTRFFVVVVSILSSFQVFDLVYIMTQGGPDYATNTTVYYIYDQAFHFDKLGYASAMATALFIILIVITLIQIRVQRSGRIE
jgi:multiple sugar transport system permease protein